MLPQQQKIQLSSFSELYDLIVPKENLLRKINEMIDFSFIYKELVDKYCSNTQLVAEGRNSEMDVVVNQSKWELIKKIVEDDTSGNKG